LLSTICPYGAPAPPPPVLEPAAFPHPEVPAVEEIQAH
jgi:hypothetical protein